MSTEEEFSNITATHLAACLSSVPELLGDLVVVNGVNLVSGQVYNLVQYINNAYLANLTNNNQVEVPVNA